MSFSFRFVQNEIWRHPLRALVMKGQEVASPLGACYAKWLRQPTATAAQLPTYRLAASPHPSNPTPLSGWATTRGPCWPRC